jgi:putative radical SAM enzyme (TIGR03279 family)
MGVEITAIEPGSAAERCHLRVGDILHSVDGHPIRDCMDYRFYTTGRLLKLEVERQGRKFRMLVKKEEYQELGLDFATYLMDKPRSCHNRCIFCFIDQLPKGMRDTLYFKDDDTRLSFLTGNYVTLTNVGQEDLQRIARQHISPINISVQATDPQLRVSMLRNNRADRLMDQMAYLARHRIQMNCQIVLCKGVNDGVQLERSLTDLEKLYPAVHSVSVVPVGLSRYREGLYPLEPFEPEDARQVVEQVERLAEACRRRHGSRLFYLADEFYLKAGLPIPPAEEYDGFPQIENGVGLLASLREEFTQALEQLEVAPATGDKRVISLATGEAAYGHLRQMVDELTARCHNLEVKMYQINNQFFGERITVTGLITGGDLMDQLRGKELGEALYISACMLRDEGDVFLDDVTPKQVEQELGVPLIPCPNDGWELVRLLSGRNVQCQDQ